MGSVIYGNGHTFQACSLIAHLCLTDTGPSLIGLRTPCNNEGTDSSYNRDASSSRRKVNS